MLCRSLEDVPALLFVLAGLSGVSQLDPGSAELLAGVREAKCTRPALSPSSCFYSSTQRKHSGISRFFREVYLSPKQICW